MRIANVGVLLLSGVLAACGGSDNDSSSSSSKANSSAVSSSTSSAISEISSSSSLASSSSESSQQSSSASPTDPIAIWRCPESGLYFCDDFEAGAGNWDLLPDNNNALQPDGVMEHVEVDGNPMLRYTAASKGGVLALIKPESFSGVTGTDYFVEAKIRPRKNGTTGNKQLYLLTRYVDGNNWYAGVLNVQNDPANTQVEIARSVAGSISRPVQKKRPIEMGERDADDGIWYSLRIDAVGDSLTVYLDGEFIGTTTDTSYSERGLIGLWTSNKSFEVDDIQVGDPAIKPVSLTIDPVDTTYTAEALDQPKLITVTATKADGSADTFTVTSSNPSVVSATVNENIVTLTPLAEGEATITFTSGTDKNRTRVITANIAPAFVMSVATYDLSGKVFPAVNESGVYEDTPLRVSFDNPVELGEVGLVRIYKASDDSLVDTISLIDESENLGVGPTLRQINTEPIRASGNTLTINPHAGALQVGEAYWVAIGESLIQPNSIGGKTFEGIGKDAGWKFTLRSSAPAIGLTEVTVDDDGNSADFRSVQSALNYAMSNATVNTVSINDGVYEEPLYLRERSNLIIRGESRNETVVQYPNNNGLNPSTDGRALFLISNGDLITLENFTIHNTTLIGEGGQAETIYFNSSNGRLIARQMNFISEQDTILVKGWSWLYQSLVAGNVDFIWGYAKAALFEESEIRTLGDSRGNGNGGYILQARVENESDKGFVFLNSSLTYGAGPLGHTPDAEKTYLARSGGNTSYFDNIVFVNNKMDTHIAPIGWSGLGVANQPAHNPSPSIATAGWREYNTMDMNGDPLDLSLREFGHTMNRAEVDGYCSRAQIFSGFDNGIGWNPLPGDTKDCELSW